MKPSENDSNELSNNTEPPVPSPKPVTSKPVETPPSEQEWFERVTRNLERLNTDEKYREEIAKKQF